MSVFSDVKKALKKVGSLDRDIKRAFRDIENAGRKIEGVGREAGDALKRLDQADDEFRKVWEKIEHLPDTIEDLVEEAFEELAQEAAQQSIKEILDNAADVIEIMAPTRFTLIFGIEVALIVQAEVGVSCTIPNPIAKLTEIRHWANNPPKGRAQIIECIRDFAPESLSAEFKVSGNGLGAEWDGDDKFDRIDAFLEKHGVR